MEDVRGAAFDEGGRAAAAAARLAVVQLALGAAIGAVPPDALEEARAAATAYVRAGGLSPAEAAALSAGASAAGPEPSPDLPVALGLAAASALADGQPGGAATLWRATYALATRWGYHEEAARAAEALAGLARTGGSASSAAGWRRRARRHARRVASAPPPA